jgi:hypothetical protein
MKCPYFINIRQDTKFNCKYNENNLLEKENKIFLETATHKECIGQECMAFNDGKCDYRS